jgi:predicted nucleotidyltransferase
MKPSELIATQRDRILAIAAAHGASNLRVFGSVAKGLDEEGSDLDLLVDIQPGTSLFQFAGLQIDIEEALGLKVDLCTEAQLHPKLKGRILSDARPL